MAGGAKRTSVALGVLALVFVVIIVILCLVPRPCTGPDCKVSSVGAQEHAGSPLSSTTLSSTTKESTTSPSTTKAATQAPSTTEKSTVLSSTDISTTEVPLATLQSSTVVSSTEKSTTASSTVEGSTNVSDEDSTTLLSTTSEGTTAFSSSTEWSHTAPSTAEGTTSSTEETPITENQFSSVQSTVEATNTTTSYEESSTTLSTLSSTSDESTTLSPSTEGSTVSTMDEEWTSTSDASDESTVSSTTLSLTTTPDTTTYLTTTEQPTVSSTTEYSTTEFTTDSSTTDGSTTVDTKTVIFVGDECNTTTCKEIAARMLYKMDHGDVTPCEDFYQYSCGGVIDDPFLDPENQQLLTENFIKEKLMRVSRDDPEFGPLRVFYDSCINYIKNNSETYRLQQAKNVFSSVGYEHLEENLSDFNSVKLTQLLAKMMKMHFTPLFDLLLDVDTKDPSKFVFKLTPPLFTSPFSDDLAKAVCLKQHKQRLEEAKINNLTVDINKEYDIYNDCMLHGSGYKARMERMVDAVKDMKLMGHIKNETALEARLTAIKINCDIFIESLVEFFPKVPDLRMINLQKQFDEFTLQDLDEDRVFNSPIIEWKILLEELLGKAVDPSSTVQVYFKDELNEILTEIETEFFANATNLQTTLLFMWSERIYTDLVKPVGAALSSPKYCYRVTNSLMEDFISYLYLDNLPDLPGKQEQIENMIKLQKIVATMELRRTFVHQPDNAFIKKLQMMSGEVAELDDIKKATQKNMVGITLNDNFILNTKTLLKRYRSLIYSMYEKLPGNPQVMWNQFLLPYSPYGMSLYTLNKFLIPYAALEVPLFYHDAPSYINYAGIGHMIAHEIAHGFDGTGIFYGGKEKLKTVMDGAHKYVSATEMLQEQLQYPHTFNSSTGLRSTFRLNSRLTLNEAMADSAAYRLAWESYLANIMSSITTTQAPEPKFGGRGMDSHRRRSVNRYPSGNPSATRLKRETSSPYLPPLFSPEQRLPWLDLNPSQLYYLRTVQNQCSGSSDVDMLTLMENEHLPPRLRVNIVLRNDPLFAKAFNCQDGSKMKLPMQHPFVLG